MELKNPLLPHQEEAIKKLKALKVGALFMEQGTGKTVTALELCRIRLAADKIDKVIWLCPCSVKINLKRELIKQTPDGLLQAITICGIETLSTSTKALEYLSLLVLRHRVFLVVDESLLIKNPKAYRTKHILQLAEQCPYRLILNGTPISQNEADLYSQFLILDWRILGYKSYYSFAANHIEYDEKVPGKIRRCLNTEHLARKIDPYTYQCKKEECIQLPPKETSDYGFDLTEEQIGHYLETADRMLSQIDERKPETVYRLFSALQAITAGFYIEEKKNHLQRRNFFLHPEENPRIQALLEILVPIKEKAIIFCKYHQEAEEITNLLNSNFGSCAVKFDATVPQRKRQQNLLEFQDNATYLVANRGCASFGLNLQVCHHVVYYNNDWDLAKKLQSEDRVHRYGQKEIVRIQNLYARDTLDERILDCLFRKETLLERFKKDLGKEKAGLRNFLFMNRETVPDLIEF